MKHVHLGRSGLKVSNLCLGTMNFGPHSTEAESFAIMDKALELGINFFDTANVYGWKPGEGVTEKIVGRWFAQGGGRREKVVLATKVYGDMNTTPGADPNQAAGLSARKIIDNCEASLRRLQTDRIDLYQMHHIDRTCPFDEIWQAMETLVAQGKIVYAGSSNFAGWDIATAQQTAAHRHFPGLVSDQSIYNLEQRTIELEVLPACRHYGLGVIPWSPLAGGLLGGALQKQAAGNLDQAIKLLGNSPEAGYALYLRAKIYTLREEDDDALRVLNKAAVLRPDLAEIWADLGEVRKTKLDGHGALAAFKRAVELNPADAVAQYRLGAEYLRQDEAAPAAEHLELAYKSNSQDQSVLNALQSALRKEGKLAEANKIRAQLTELLRQRDEAMQKSVTAIKLNNEGASLQKDGNLPGALDKYREASQLDPNHVGIRVNYAVALLRLGHWTDGLNELHEALRRDPGNDQIRLALKDALSQAPPALVPKWNDDAPR